MKKLLSTLLILSMFTALDGIIVNAQSESESILVGQATTLEEKIDVALREIDLNIDLNNVVTDILVPTSGLYNSSFTWQSSNSDVASVSSGRIKITRPNVGENAVEVTLTVTGKIIINKDEMVEKNREFKIKVLPLGQDELVNTTEENLFSEDFKEYPTGEDIGEYLAWNSSTTDAITEIVESVPNNESLEDKKILKINSIKTSKDISYTRRLYTEENFVVEGYLMYYGQINGVFLQLGRDEIYGPAIGITHESFYSGANKFSSEQMKPVEGVWSKFRIEVNPKNRSYNLKMYTFDGSNTVETITTNKAYAGSSRYINEFRINVKGGDKTGQVYLTDIKMGYDADMPVLEGINPNRTDGIGEIKNFEENILHIVSDDSSVFNPNFEVYNRFDASQLYVKDVDYSVESQIVTTSDKIDQVKYIITLKKTNEVKELLQTVYKEKQEGLPYIDNIKVSHLARREISEGVLSSKGYISFNGTVTRNDGVVYYGLSTNKIENISEENIISGGSSLFMYSGNFNQTTRNVSFSIEDLSLSYEYYLYVVIKNDNGVSEIYQENSITEVINISTCEQFYDMTINVTTYKNEFRLLNDLDFSNYTWVCDEANQLKFEGYVDGQGYTISNLKIESPYRKAAIFFEITDATIKNLNFVNCDVYGLQDSAILCGYSNGGNIENITFNDCNVYYNDNAGSEGYFAVVVARLHKETTNMTNILIDKCHVDSNKYSGILTGNVNKGADKNCVLNAKNIYVNATMYSDGAALGLIGRNRGTSNIENCIVYIDIKFAKKEMGVFAGHNKEGGVLNVKNAIGKLNVGECTQPTYFNNFIGSHDKSTSKYTFENIYFFKVDYSHISDSLIPVPTALTAGVELIEQTVMDERWWEENTFINCFETDLVWDFNEETSQPKLNINKQINVTAEMVNNHISLIKNDYSQDDHYHIYQALQIYEKLSAAEKQKVNKQTLDESKQKYDSFINSLNNVK